MKSEDYFLNQSFIRAFEQNQLFGVEIKNPLIKNFSQRKKNF